MKHLNNTIWICVQTIDLNNLEFVKDTLYYLKGCDYKNISIEHHSGEVRTINSVTLLKHFKPY